MTIPAHTPARAGAERRPGASRLEDLAALRRRTQALARMRALARTGTVSVPAGARTSPQERCDLCTTKIPDDHRHLIQLEERRIVCACEACWALHSGDAEYRPTGTRTLWLERFRCDEETWGRFQIPIALAFFMRSSITGGVVAFYPSPAGATESELSLEAWDALVALNPVLAELDPDGEALVVNRLSDPHQHVIAPIDDCYALVGLIKTRWEGISGGDALTEAVPAFLESMRARALVAQGRMTHAGDMPGSVSRGRRSP
ncbi:MAG TPA: DUF5947 family protein [Solirubrobacteraceae bacterium]|nr:DUF5947 family protein [Solirubrobacteraceae bacterium]